MYQQHPPNCIQIEPTEGCNLRCTFCGINGIRTQKNVRSDDRFLTVELAEILAKRIADAVADGWNPRLEFAMHGEPTLNPNLAQIFRTFRRALPRQHIMLTTNGVPLQMHADGFTQAVDRLFEAGVNTIAFDNYEGLKVAPLARAYAEERRIPLYDYPADPDGSPHHRHAPSHRQITIVRDISLTSTGSHSTTHLGNHGGAAAPLDDRAAGKRCALPFRELSIRWNGEVALCCNDWRGIFKLGNVAERSLAEIWNDPALYGARKHLLRGERVFGPCAGCTHTSWRPGLLPDPMGKETYPPADASDDAAIAEACAGPTLTRPVVRPWELQGRTNLVVRPAASEA